MITIAATYQLKLDGDPAACALVARQLLDYLSEAAGDLQNTILECGHPPYDDNWDEHEEQISMTQEMFEAWNSSNWLLDVVPGRLSINADPAPRQGDAVGAAAAIDAYLERNHCTAPGAKLDSLRLATTYSIYNTLADSHLLGNLTFSDIAAGHRFLLYLLEAGIPIEHSGAQTCHAKEMQP